MKKESLFSAADFKMSTKTNQNFIFTKLVLQIQTN